jgi:hypothetical protein
MADAFDTKRMTLEAERNRQAEAFQQKLLLSQMKDANSPPIAPEGIDEMVDQYMAGDKSVTSRLGSGFSGSGGANRANFQAALVAKMKKQGLTGKDIADRTAEFVGETQAQRTLGTQSGRVQGAIGALQTTAPLAIQASSDVDRTEFPDFNKIENAVRTGTGDTKIVLFNAYNQAIVNDYAQIMRRGGASTDEASRRANDILSTSFSKGQYAAGVQALNTEATAVQNGLQNAKDTIAGKVKSTPHENVTEDQYNKLQKGQKYWFDGKEYTKGEP